MGVVGVDVMVAVVESAGRLEGGRGRGWTRYVLIPTNYLGTILMVGGGNSLLSGSGRHAFLYGTYHKKYVLESVVRHFYDIWYSTISLSIELIDLVWYSTLWYYIGYFLLNRILPLFLNNALSFSGSCDYYYFLTLT